MAVASFENAAASDILKRRIKKEMLKYQRFEGDTGSTEVQVAVTCLKLEHMREKCRNFRKVCPPSPMHPSPFWSPSPYLEFLSWYVSLASFLLPTQCLARVITFICNRQDFVAYRALDALFHKRRSLMKYLKRER
jgi:ribosomal protein S15P/S13E